MADLGEAQGASPPHGPKFSQFHAVFRKFWQFRMLATPGRLAPLLRGILDPALIVEPTAWEAFNQTIVKIRCMKFKS